MKILFSFICLLFAFNGQAQKLIENGSYKVNVRGDVYYYNFSQDTVLNIIHGSDTSLCYWKADTTQSPMHIDLRMMDQQGNQLYISKGIYEWIGPGKYRMRTAADMKSRPIGFLPRGSLDIIILVKVK